MSKKALLLVALFVFVVFRVPAYPGSSTRPASAAGSATASGPASGAPSFGHTWNSYSDKEKHAFLMGLGTGARAICTDISSMQKDASTQTIETTYRDCFNTYAGMDPNKVVANMNALYADSKNAVIPIDGAYRIALMQARGDKVDEVIVQSRKYGENLMKVLDQQRQKAGQ